MLSVRWLKSAFLLGLVALSMVLAVACGSSAPATQAAPTVAPVAPIATAVPTPVATAAPAPTAAAAATAVPAAVPTAKVGKFPAIPFELLEAVEGNPKHGGILRYAIPVSLAIFDLHQATSGVNSLITQNMFDNIIRLHPLSAGREIIPDLAHSWDISEDGKLYTFYLLEGVKFHDGALLTSEDVKATYDRIAFPPEAMISPRQTLFKTATVTEVRAIDPLTVQFVLSESRPASMVLSAIASGWNGIVRKQTLMDNNFDLKRVKGYPTTGPFKFIEYSDNESFEVERNDDYWNGELPYLDGLKFLHAAAYEPEAAAVLLSGRVDFSIAMEPGGWQKATDTAGITTVHYPQTAFFGIWMNAQKPPLDDARIRRAIHLVISREAMIEINKTTFASYWGAGFVFPFGPWSTPVEELMQRPGYREGTDRDQDIQTAQALLAEAGYPNGEGIGELDLLVRGVSHWQNQAGAAQNMLDVALNIKTKIRTADLSGWYEEAERGNFDLTVTAAELTSAEPSAWLGQMFRKGAAGNWGRWENDEMESFLDQIDREADPVKRFNLIHDAGLLLEEEAPVAPVAFEQHAPGWWSYVKGHDTANNVGIWDVNRFDTWWLDK